MTEVSLSVCPLEIDLHTWLENIENVDVGIVAAKLIFGMDGVKSVVSRKPHDGFGYTVHTDFEDFCVSNGVGGSYNQHDLRHREEYEVSHGEENEDVVFMIEGSELIVGLRKWRGMLKCTSS